MTEHINVTLADLHALRSRIESKQLESDDWRLLDALVAKTIASTEARRERLLAKIAAATAATTGDEPAAGAIIDAELQTPEERVSTRDAGAASVGAETEPASASTGDNAAIEPAAKKPKGHGRSGARAYTKAEHIRHGLAADPRGMLCTGCGRGRMSPYREKVIIRVVGQPLFHAEAHHLEQARCRLCGEIRRASCPDAVREGLGGDYVRYDWSACAMLIVMHYFGGAPFKRLEALHAGWGIPMADANQWEMATASDDLLSPLYRALERYAIQLASSFRIDDTGSMIIAVRRRIEEELASKKRAGESTKDVRTGINATAAYFETPAGPVVLFFTGLHHAGEIVDRLLAHRTRAATAKLVKTSDGASKNFDHAHADELIESTCNAHALLKFRAIKDKYPGEYEVAGRVYKEVFDRDDEARKLDLSPDERMLHHRRHSLPLMKELKSMCEQKLASRLVEPNSPLWEPLSFIINQWDRLVRFCETPGVPLDTNLVEQALIMPVRYLAGSFNYQSEDGAEVGDHFMSLIATARAHDVEPVEYLTECLRHHEDLARRPEHYLPWAYRERRKHGDSPPEHTQGVAA